MRRILLRTLSALVLILVVLGAFVFARSELALRKQLAEDARRAAGTA